jgi:hypothetical protein
VFLIVIPSALFLLFFVPAIINILVAAWAILRASPLFDFVVAPGEDEWTAIEGEGQEPLPPEEIVEPQQLQNVVFRRRGIGDRIADFVRHNFIPGWRPVKKKKE